MCCDYHIGRAVKDKLAECNSKCDKVINDAVGTKNSKSSNSQPNSAQRKDSNKKKLKAAKKIPKKVKAEQKMKDFFKE